MDATLFMVDLGRDFATVFVPARGDLSLQAWLQAWLRSRPLPAIGGLTITALLTSKRGRARWTPSGAGITKNLLKPRKARSAALTQPVFVMTASALPDFVLSEPHLAEYALDARPLWLFTPDGAALLWANRPGAAIMSQGPVAGATRSQIAFIAGRLPPGATARLERLRGFGAPLAGLRTCRCMRLKLHDGASAIMIAALDAERPWPIEQELAALVGDADDLVALYPDGTLAAASERAAARSAGLLPIERTALASAHVAALKSGRGEGTGANVFAEFFRIGAGERIAVIARLHAARAEHVDRAPPPAPKNETPAAMPAAEDAPVATADVDATAPDAPPAYRYPVRFMWQTDAQGRFALGSDEFARLVGPSTMATFGRPWREIDAHFHIDPEGRVARALETRDTWSGIAVQWPFDGDLRLPVEMSGLPAFDRDRNFLGYRGFGVCRDLDGLNRLAAARWHDRSALTPAEQPAGGHDITAASPPDHPRPDLASPQSPANSQLSVMQTEPPANVVPFRPAGEPRGTGPTPTLSPNESSAFDELARQLSERLTRPAPAAPPMPVTEEPRAADAISTSGETDKAEPQTPAPQPFGAPALSRPLLERLPVGILIYRLDRLLFVNRAFLDFCGFATLDDLSDAGGLDALFVEPVDGAPGNGEGRALRVATARADIKPVDARLYSVPWHEETALALVMMPASDMTHAQAAPVAAPAPSETPGNASAQARAAELLDLSGDAIAALDADGTIRECNRVLARWTGRAREALIGTRLVDCLAQDSRPAAQQAIEAALNPNVTSLQRRQSDGVSAGLVGADGGQRPVLASFTPSSSDAGALNAVLRDESARRESDRTLRAAEAEARRAREARTGLLARISHEIRAPLNAIIGFANVMLEGRFGPVGNDRYEAYLKDIRTSGESVTALIDGLVDLSHIETGQAEFSFAEIHLNELVEHCVALMQPQANRQRIIIRTSLTHNLPPVSADPGALRQVVKNLLGHSVAASETGGQVIVSTALGERGDVFLRIRDSGPAMSDADIAAAMDPFGPYQAGDTRGMRENLSLPLTRALTEANKARFNITGGAHGQGTLIEILFPQVQARVS